ncbi:hypothetical protein AB4Y38_42840, partial [Paraburkholderia sp. EG285A]|uniref:hypothetical protein n=1 Tax=Paraburkholderia sp. EG285A TaxID=3237009 RepID=UPI0034D2C5BE
SENEGHHASKAGRPTCQQTLTADTPNVKKDQRSESVLCRPSLDQLLNMNFYYGNLTHTNTCMRRR